jgi:hypothetical protein
LAEDPRFLRLVNVEPKAYAIIDEIVDDADGVFLWVFLVINSLLRGLNDHDDTRELRRRLNEMPTDLDKYFRRTFDNIEDVYRPEAMRALQLLAVAEDNIPLMFIYCISQELHDPGYGLGAETRTMTKAELDKARGKSRSCVNKWCRDLVEIGRYHRDEDPVHRNELISVSHRTVRDFLLTQEMQKEFSKYPICQFSPLKGGCMAYLALIKIWPPTSIADMNHTIDNITEWAKKCEHRESMTPFEILDDLDLTQRTQRTVSSTEQKKRGWRNRLPPHSIQVLPSAVEHGLTLYVGQCFERDTSCKIDIWKAVLDITPREVKLEMIRTLLAKGFDPNDILDTSTHDDSLRNKTAWQLSLQRSKGITGYSYHRVAKLLLLNGADPDVEIKGSDGRLYDVRQCILASDWYTFQRDKPACEREIDSWLAEARARKAAKTLKGLEDKEDAEWLLL